MIVLKSALAPFCQMFTWVFTQHSCFTAQTRHLKHRHWDSTHSFMHLTFHRTITKHLMEAVFPDVYFGGFEDAVLLQTADLFQTKDNARNIRPSFNLLGINLRTMQKAVKVKHFFWKSLFLQDVESKTEGNLIRALTGDANRCWYHRKGMRLEARWISSMT